MSLGVAAALAGGAFAAGWAASSLRFRRRQDLRARFLSFVAHEFNSPLAAINMTVLNFLSGVFGPVPQEHRPWLLLLREQTARLCDLVEDFRDFVHVEFQSRLDLTHSPVSLRLLLSQRLELIAESLARNGIQVEDSLPGDLPPVGGDPDRIGRVLASVLAHARKFRTSGPIAVSGEAHAGEALVRLEYIGHKPPPPGDADALDLFYPVSKAQSQVLAGTGLGLGLSRRILQAHGGDMTLDAGPRGGCRITLRLPRQGGGS